MSGDSEGTGTTAGLIGDDVGTFLKDPAADDPAPDRETGEDDGPDPAPAPLGGAALALSLMAADTLDLIAAGHADDGQHDQGAVWAAAVATFQSAPATIPEWAYGPATVVQVFALAGPMLGDSEQGMTPADPGQAALVLVAVSTLTSDDLPI